MEVFSIGHKVRFKLSKLEGIIGKISIYSNIYFEYDIVYWKDDKSYKINVNPNEIESIDNNQKMKIGFK